MTKQITIVEPTVLRDFEDIQLVVESSKQGEYHGWYIILKAGEVKRVTCYDSIAFNAYEKLVIKHYIK